MDSLEEHMVPQVVMDFAGLREPELSEKAGEYYKWQFPEDPGFTLAEFIDRLKAEVPKYQP